MASGDIRFSFDSSCLARSTQPSYLLKSAWIAMQTPGPIHQTSNPVTMITPFSKSICRRLNGVLLPRTNVDLGTVHDKTLGDHLADSGTTSLPIRYPERDSTVTRTTLPFTLNKD